MKIKVSDLRATVDYLDKEKVLDVEIVTSDSERGSKFGVDFEFADATTANCTIRCFSADLGTLRRLIKDMVHYKPKPR